MDITTYLDRTGTIPLLSVLDHEHKRFSELEGELLVSSSTLSNRLEEGREIGLVSASVVDAEEGGTKKVYHLTEGGETVYRQMTALGIPQAYTKMVAFHEQVEEETEELKEWVQENWMQIEMGIEDDGLPSERRPE